MIENVLLQDLTLARSYDASSDLNFGANYYDEAGKTAAIMWLPGSGLALQHSNSGTNGVTH